MKVLVLGGTLFFGIPMVEELLKRGHDVTIASRGKAINPFGDCVNKIIIDRFNEESIVNGLGGKEYDVVIDKIAYSSNDVRRLLNNIKCGKYIFMSSMQVYKPLHWDMKESEVNLLDSDLIWRERSDCSYGEAKRDAEVVLANKILIDNWQSVRYPFVVGLDDYTKRLYFYVEHVLNEKSMYIDNIDNKMSFIKSDEAGGFMAHLVERDYIGAINGANSGEISIKDIISYVEKKSGKKALLSDDGDIAPYNSTPEYSLNIDLSKKLGFSFSPINSWIYKLLDDLMEI